LHLKDKMRRNGFAQDFWILSVVEDQIYRGNKTAYIKTKNKEKVKRILILKKKLNQHETK
jgi:hypothetical protein